MAIQGKNPLAGILGATDRPSRSSVLKKDEDFESSLGMALFALVPSPPLAAGEDRGSPDVRTGGDRPVEAPSRATGHVTAAAAQSGNRRGLVIDGIAAASRFQAAGVAGSFEETSRGDFGASAALADSASLAQVPAAGGATITEADTHRATQSGYRQGPAADRIAAPTRSSAAADAVAVSLQYSVQYSAHDDPAQGYRSANDAETSEDPVAKPSLALATPQAQYTDKRPQPEVVNRVALEAASVDSGAGLSSARAEVHVSHAENAAVAQGAAARATAAASQPASASEAASLPAPENAQAPVQVVAQHAANAASQPTASGADGGGSPPGGTGQSAPAVAASSAPATATAPHAARPEAIVGSVKPNIVSRADSKPRAAHAGAAAARGALGDDSARSAPAPGPVSAPRPIATPSAAPTRIANLRVDLAAGQSTHATVRERSGAVDVRIVTPSQQTAEQIGAGMPALRRALDAAGVQLRTVDVHHQGGGDRRHDEQRPQREGPPGEGSGPSIFSIEEAKQ